MSNKQMGKGWEKRRDGLELQFGEFQQLMVGCGIWEEEVKSDRRNREH